jgi:pimeloyl-ACP methyl ester carboxylesterase
MIKNSKSGIFTSFDGTKIYYEMSGQKSSGKTLLFLHGLGGNLTAWDPQRAYFGKLGFRTIAIDIRGHGLSDRPKDRSKYTPEILAKDILAFIEKFKIKNFILVGHCLGGILSLILTGEYKVKPRVLILVATTYEFPFYATLLQRSRILNILSDALNLLPFPLGKPGQMPIEKFRGTHDLSPRRILNDIFYTTPRSFVSLYSNLLLFNGQKFLKNIKCPTLIIHGEKDVFFSPKIAMRLNKYIKNSKLILIPNANHILVLNNPTDLNQIIDKYLKQIKN